MGKEGNLAQLIEDFLQHLEIEKNCSPLTIRDYRHYLTRFSAWLSASALPGRDGSSTLPDLSVKNIDLETMKRYRVYMAHYSDEGGRTLSRSTQAYHVIALRSFLRWLIKNDYETLSPDKIDLPKGESRSLKFLDQEQLSLLLNQPDWNTIHGLRDRTILEVLFSTGLRVSELVKLDRDTVNLERREFGIIGKGGKARVVFLSQEAVGWLGRYFASREDHYKPVFIRHLKKLDPAVLDEKMRLTVRTIQRIVEKYVRKAHLPVKITPHGLRHTFATDLLIAGADIRSVQEMLGHKNIATTQIYTHVTNKQLKKIHEEFHGRKK